VLHCPHVEEKGKKGAKPPDIVGFCICNYTNCSGWVAVWFAVTQGTFEGKENRCEGSR